MKTPRSIWYKQLGDRLMQDKTLGTIIGDEILNLGFTSVQNNAHFVRIRKYMQTQGIDSVEANLILKRSSDEIKKCQNEEFKRQQEMNEKGIERLQEFKSVSLLKNRIKKIKFINAPTIDELIDIMILFCMRLNEYKTLKLHIRQETTISGFSKQKGDQNEEREFVCVFAKSQYKFINNILLWLQSHELHVDKLLGAQYVQLNNYLESKYQITGKVLRKIGVDLILQYIKQKNPSSTQMLILKATRHKYVIDSQQGYGIINQQLQVESEGEWPLQVCGFKIYKRPNNDHVAIRKINGKKVQIIVENNKDDIQQKIIDYCTSKKIELKKNKLSDFELIIQ